MSMASDNGALFLKIFLIFSILSSSQGKDFTNVGRPHFLKASTFPSRPSHEHYDYIIVGGCTAGCPLAATLSHKYNVLLLERGGSPYGNVNVSWLQNFHIGLADTSPTSAAQPFISTDGVINARARVLGGGTCINAGFYTRANTSYVKDAGWDIDLVNESYPWVEKQVVHWPKLEPWQAAVRDGLLQAGVDPFNGFTYDHLYGTKVGGTIFDENGFRSTSADLMSSSNPNNLSVLLHGGDTNPGSAPSFIIYPFIHEIGPALHWPNSFIYKSGSVPHKLSRGEYIIASLTASLPAQPS